MPNKTKRQLRTTRRQNQKEKKHRKKTQMKQTSIRRYSPPKYTLPKKLSLIALASSQGINPFKRSQMQYGESGVKDIGYDIAKQHGLSKSAYKVAKEASKKYTRQIKTHRPTQISFVPDVEKPDSRALSTAYSTQKLPSPIKRRTRKRKH